MTIEEQYRNKKRFQSLIVLLTALKNKTSVAQAALEARVG